jgi:hypothetical protein
LRVGLALVTLVALGALGGAWLVLERGSGSPATVSEHSTPVPQAARTVTVSATMPVPSAHAERLSAMLEAGAMPREPMLGEVLTDTDCAPDAAMVSRCRNELRLRDGSTIVLRHPHDMSRVPCLAPGEQALVVPPSA